MLGVKKVMHVFRYGTELQKALVTELKKGARQRKELVSALNTPRTTIYDNLEKLESKGIAERYRVYNGRRGRPRKFWKLTEDAKEYLYLLGNAGVR